MILSRIEKPPSIRSGFSRSEKSRLNLDIRSNEAAATKSKAIHDLTRKKNPLRSALGKMLPKSLRRSAQQFLTGRNTETIQNPKLDLKRERELIEKYFIEDIHKLEKIIHRDLSTCTVENDGQKSFSKPAHCWCC
jgi:hypothetical protein